MSANQGQQIQLPPIVKFVMPAQHALVILSALEQSGPYKDVNLVIQNLQQQLLSQQPKLVAEQYPDITPLPIGGPVAASADLPLPPHVKDRPQPPRSAELLSDSSALALDLND